MNDVVNHPTHYESGQFECIDVMLETQGIEATQNFCVCNAFKYLYRWKNKNGVEDIKKAKRYIDKFLELDLKGNKYDMNRRMYDLLKQSYDGEQVIEYIQKLERAIDGACEELSKFAIASERCIDECPLKKECEKRSLICEYKDGWKGYFLK